MTSRQIFEATLIELSKMQMPALKLHEFNYLFNKAINQYINKVYNVYDLRVLKSTAYMKPHKVSYGNLPFRNYKGDSTTYDTINSDKVTPTTNSYGSGDTVNHSNASSYLSKAHSSIQSLNGATYEVFMPIDYLHMLNCVCIYYVAKQKDCYDAGSYIQIPATRLTADSWSQIVTDIYNRPTPMHPYYYIHNQNTNITLPTAPVKADEGGVSDDNPSGYSGTDLAGKYEVTDTDGGVATSTNGGSNFQRTFQLNNNQQISLVEKPTATRIANPTNVRCEIRYGRDDSLFQLVEVQIDYVKSPQFIRLTQEQIDLTEDTSQIMEFPDYVNQEIINELVHLVMVHSNDPRLPNDMQITNTIARPTGQQQQAAPQQAAQ